MNDHILPVKLVIAGTGSPDVVQLIADINVDPAKQIELLGFLDDNPANSDKKHSGYGVIGGFDWISGRSDVVVFNSIARTTTIRHAAQRRLESFGARFISLIHPSVSTQFASVGVGSLIAKNVYLEAKTTIGNHCIILANTTIAHDSTIDDCCFLGHGCHVQGGVRIKERCFLGAGTTVFPDCTVNRQTTLGLNSVLIRDTTEGEIISAAPSRRIK